MSVAFQVFIDNQCSQEDMVTFLSERLSIPLTRKVEDGEVSYYAQLVGLHIDFYEATDFVDNMGIEFTRYAYVLDVSPVRLLTNFPEEDIDWARQFVLYIAKAINARTLSGCIAVEDVQLLLAEYKRLES